MRKTAAEWVPAVYVKSGHGSSPRPHLRRRWSELRKLRWHASLIMSEHPGLLIYVEKGRSWISGRFQYGQVSISVAHKSGGLGLSPMPYDEAWTYLNGLAQGLRLGSEIAGVER